MIERKTFDPNWIAGFTVGDGSFYIMILKSSTMKSGEQVSLGFQITQDIRDLELMDSLKSYLNCGRLGKKKKY